MIFVVDTSVAVKWFVEEVEHEYAKGLLLPGTQLAAPDLIIVEVANALRRKQRTQQMTADQVDEALVKLPSFFQNLELSTGLIADAMLIARTIEHSRYDCLFAAIALRTPDAFLVTADERFSTKLQAGEFKALLRPLSSIAPISDS